MTRDKFVMYVLQRYWRWARGLTLGAQGLVIDADNRVLLVRHTYRPGWHFPGGGVEKNETALTALERELSEEAGIVIAGTPELFSIYANFRYFPNDHVAFFVVRSWRQPIIPAPNNEIADHGFFPRDRLPQSTNRAVIARLAEVFDNAPPDALW